MQFKIMLLSLLLIGCSRAVDAQKYKKVASEYCEPCGGLRGAFINDHGQSIMCVNGHQLKAEWNELPKVLAIGVCK